MSPHGTRERAGSGPAQLPTDLEALLLLLLRAYEEAELANQSPWACAVPVRALQALHIPADQVQGLLDAGWLEQGVVIEGESRPCGTLQAGHIPKNACFVLSASGLRGAQRLPRAVRRLKSTDLRVMLLGTSESRKVVPHWDNELRQLTYLGYLVKRFPVPALDQEPILDAFQTQAWPPWIDDPRPPAAGYNSKQSLPYIIQYLNHHQAHELLHFHGVVTGGCICWEPRLEMYPKVTPKSPRRASDEP